MKRRLAVAWTGILLAAVVAWPARVRAENPDAAARAMIARYVGGWDVQGLLDKPVIASELRALVGDAHAQLERNLGVNAGVEYYGSALTIRGNAPHRGTEEEAVICIVPYGAAPRVHAAIYSRGAVTVYTRESRYEFLPTCVKDWITQVNTGHTDRLRQPGNVTLIPPS